MSSAFEKLQRILELEREQNCQDRAVIGGLERFLTYWRKEAELESSQRAVPLDVEEVLQYLGSYGGLTAAQRREAVAYVLDRLEGGAPRRPEREAEEPEKRQPLPKQESPERPEPSERERAGGGRGASLSLGSSVDTLRGVGPVRKKQLGQLGIETVRDLIYHLPRRYDDYGSLKPINRLELGEEVTIVGVVQRVESHRARSGMPLVKVNLSDGTASIEATWFNQPHLAKRFRKGQELALSGEVEEFLGRLVFTSPQWEPVKRELLHTGRLVPIYPLTEGISARWLRKLINRTLAQWATRIVDPLPSTVIESAHLIGLRQAIRYIHFPPDKESLEQARRRLCFDELFLLQLGVLARRRAWREEETRAVDVDAERIDAFLSQLPYDLTDAQRRAIDEILSDLSRPVPMNRLLQGDVGSGKTIVALTAMLAAAQDGQQAALMAPTSILAEQHYQTVTDLLEEHGIDELRCALLIGGLSAAEKERVQAGVASGQIDVVIGTHALIQAAVTFDQLGLVVVDEQHRFGVRQRGALWTKGDGDLRPHLLAMSATPIPRTLALTIYGDLDVSVLDEMPPHRQEVITAVRGPRSRERIYAFIDAQIEKGRQAFIICPLVEESEKIDATAAVAEHERLQREVFSHLRLGLLHGRMADDEKEETMLAFRRGEYDILVSTAVVEVGVDIPNASVMLVEGADRFGLAQLHQFRGRVGRGGHKSYCILVSDNPSPESLERLRIMEQTNDGFVLAEKDVEMRGPGDFFGVRQHGLPPLKVAKLSDVRILETARREAEKLFEEDSQLSRFEHSTLADSVRHFWNSQDLI